MKKQFIVEMDNDRTCSYCDVIYFTCNNFKHIACSGNLKSPSVSCPLVELKEMPHPCEDRPDCAGTVWPKCYVEKK